MQKQALKQGGKAGFLAIHLTDSGNNKEIDGTVGKDGPELEANEKLLKVLTGGKLKYDTLPFQFTRATLQPLQGPAVQESATDQKER